MLNFFLSTAARLLADNSGEITAKIKLWIANIDSENIPGASKFARVVGLARSLLSSKADWIIQTIVQILVAVHKRRAG